MPTDLWIERMSIHRPLAVLPPCFYRCDIYGVMSPRELIRARDLDELLREQDRVVDTAAALGGLTRGAFRWRVESGKWQRPCRGVVVAHSGPLAESEVLWTVLLWAGRGPRSLG